MRGGLRRLAVPRPDHTTLGAPPSPHQGHPCLWLPRVQGPPPPRPPDGVDDGVLRVRLKHAHRAVTAPKGEVACGGGRVQGRGEEEWARKGGRRAARESDEAHKRSTPWQRTTATHTHKLGPTTGKTQPWPPHCRQASAHSYCMHPSLSAAQVAAAGLMVSPGGGARSHSRGS